MYRLYTFAVIYHLGKRKIKLKSPIAILTSHLCPTTGHRSEESLKLPNINIKQNKQNASSATYRGA